MIASILALADHEAAAIEQLEKTGQFLGGLADRIFDWLLTYTAWWDRENTYVIIFIVKDLSPIVYFPIKTEAVHYRDARMSLNPGKEFRIGIMAKFISGNISGEYGKDNLWAIGLTRILDERTTPIYD